MHRLATCLLISWTLTLAHAQIVTMTTAAHPLPSSGVIQIYAGNFPPTGLLLFQTPALRYEGAGTVDLSLDNSNTGNFDINDLTLQVEDFPMQHVDLGPLGTADIALTGITLILNATNVSATNGGYSVDQNSLGEVIIASGNLDITNATGVLAGVIPDGYHVDFGANPVDLTFSELTTPVVGTVDQDASHFSPRAELNIGNPSFSIDTSFLQPAYVRVISEVHIAAVPEVSASVLVGMCMIGLSVVAWRRRFAQTTCSA